ncbi:predicted protein [Histoplasma capsulatum var. duboisii H88]|uniref:Predicted protein n=1 Tax=Ajellomyces capsulatus (strain H88) TaxID=544711 RepID=F0UDX6_AJEC8|nr:predicted protein [Histoplasma capsulatum var. duboisii H88]
MTEKNAAAWRCAVGRSFSSRPLAGTVPYGVRSTQYDNARPAALATGSSQRNLSTCTCTRTWTCPVVPGPIDYRVRSTWAQIIATSLSLYPDSLVESPPISPAMTKSGLLPACHQTFLHRYAVSPLLELSITNSDNA